MPARFFTVALASSVLLASCAGGSVDVVNDANEPVVIMQLDAADARLFAEIEPTGGMSVLTRWPDRCIDEDLEARLEDGTVIATRPGPFCPDDPAWVITPDDVEQARSERG